MAVQIDRKWLVVEGCEILYKADDHDDAEEWQERNRGEVIAVPENLHNVGPI